MEEIVSQFGSLLTEFKISELKKFCWNEENSDQVILSSLIISNYF